MSSRTEPPAPGLSPLSDPYDLVRLCGLWFLGLAGIYLFYGWSAFLGLGGEISAPRRAEMVLAPSMVALGLFISPSLFAAAIARVNGLEGNPRQTLAGRWAAIVLFAGIAYLLSAFGPRIVSLLTSSFPQQPPAAAAGSRPPALELARHLIPVAIAAFVPLSGIAGILIGHATNPWRFLWRNAARWVFGIALMASFLLPFLATTDSIAQHGTSPFWILVNPLALPFTLAATLAILERDALGLRLGAWWRRAHPGALDPRSLDRIITRVAEDPDSPIDPRGLSEPEREMAAFAAAIRRVAGPRAVVSESRVREIVAALVEASPDKTPEAARPRRSWFDPTVLGSFCTSWTCLAAGLLIVSPLGGVPVSVVSAAVVGFLGSAGIVLVARRVPGLAAKVSP